MRKLVFVVCVVAVPVTVVAWLFVWQALAWIAAAVVAASGAAFSLSILTWDSGWR